MLVHITEIVGSRQSGRTTKLYNEIEHSLKDRPDKIHVIISTDIKIRDLFNTVEDLGIDPMVVTINPLHKNGNLMQNRTVTKLGLDTLLEILNDKYIYLYVDNITLPMTQSTLVEVKAATNVVELFYTGIMFHFGKGRKLIKYIFDIVDFAKVKMSTIKLTRS